VELVLLSQEGETVIRVIDTGPGIPEIEREAVTQRFYRSDKTRNTKGLGLGLSMVARLSNCIASALRFRPAGLHCGNCLPKLKLMLPRERKTAELPAEIH